MKRFFVENQQGLSQDLVLSDSEHNHLANVLRLRVGEEIVIVCGDEFDYHYTIKSIAKSQTTLKLTHRTPNIYNPKQNLTVCIGVIKHDNLALAVEKLNEIGASEVILFKSAHSQNIPVKLNKLQVVAQQSCKQCRRSIPLKVSGVLSFEELIKEIPENTIFADENLSDTPSLAPRVPRVTIQVPLKTSSPDLFLKGELPRGLIIGPEGGFTAAERETLRGKATAVSLGCRILRAETAAIVGAALILFFVN